jgi:hypothetical protein
VPNSADISILTFGEPHMKRANNSEFALGSRKTAKNLDRFGELQDLRDVN